MKCGKDDLWYFISRQLVEPGPLNWNNRYTARRPIITFIIRVIQTSEGVVYTREGQGPLLVIYFTWPYNNLSCLQHKLHSVHSHHVLVATL